MRGKLVAAALVVFGLGYGALSLAQTTDPATDQRIRDLEARVSALGHIQGIKPKTAAGTVAVPAATAAAQPAPQPLPAPAPPVVSDPSPAAWGSLHRGMTVSQVTALLGKPGTTRVLPQSSTFYYPDTHGRTVEFDRNGRVDQWSQP